MSSRLEMNEEVALSAYSAGTFSGNYMAEIIDAIVVKGKNDSVAEAVQLNLKLDGRPSDKVYKLEPIYYCDSVGKPTDDNGKVLSLMYLVGATNKTAKVEVLTWDFDVAGFVKTPVDQFVELIGKKIGVTVLLSHQFKKQAVNGYTGKPYSKEEINKVDPEKVFIENYNVFNDDGSIKTGMKMRAKYFFNEFPGADGQMHKMTYQEMKTGAAGSDGKYLVELQEEKGFSDFTPEVKSPKVTEGIRREALKKNLKKLGIPFDSARFRSLDDIDESINDVDVDILGDDEDMIDDLA